MPRRLLRPLVALLLVAAVAALVAFALPGRAHLEADGGVEADAGASAGLCDPDFPSCQGDPDSGGQISPALARQALSTLTASGGTPFQGQLTDAACGTNDFPSVADGSTLNVTVTAVVPTNDIALNLLYGGKVVANSDTGVGQETLAYQVPTGDGGTYTVQICKSGAPATPFLPPGGPYPYAGVFTEVDVALPPLPGNPPGSITNPPTVTPVPSYSSWDASFAPATVADPQRTEGEPLTIPDGHGGFWESGPWGFTTSQSFVHHSTDDGKTFNLVSSTGLRPNDGPPGGGDTDLARDDQGNLYFTDLEGLAQIASSVSNDQGQTWRKNPAATTSQTAVDRQWYAVDNGTSASAADNTVFLAFHQTGLGTFILSSPGSTGPSDAVGGLVFQSSSALPAPLQPLAGDAVCGKLRFDPVKRDLYYPCNEGDHIRVTVGHVDVGQRTGIAYTNYDLPQTPGGGDVLSLFPSLATDPSGNVYVTWIDGTNFAVYYAFSTDQGKSWSNPVRVSNGPAVTNEFDWVEAGANGQIAVAWYGTDKLGPSDNMPSALADEGPATAYQWYGYAALVTGAASPTPKVAQTRFTAKPMHFGSICNSGLGCTTSTTADRQMADFFGFTLGPNGALRIVYDDTTNEFDGAALFYARQIGGPTVSGQTLSGQPATDPVSDPVGDAAFPHYAPTGPGPQYPQLDLTGLRLSSPDSKYLRVQMTVKDLSSLAPPVGKTQAVWLTRFQALGPLPTEPQDVYNVYYAEMVSTASGAPTFAAGTATCQGTTPSNCKILEYGGSQTVPGDVQGNVITIDVPLASGFGRALASDKLYSVTAFTFGRTNPQTDLYADVDATQPFDYTLGALETPVPGTHRPAGSQATGPGSEGTGGKGNGGSGVDVGKHVVRGHGTVPYSKRLRAAFTVDLRHGHLNKVVVTVRRGKHFLLRFHSLRLTQFAVKGHAARLAGIGVRNGHRVHYAVVLVDHGAKGDVFHFDLAHRASHGGKVKGYVTVK